MKNLTNLFLIFNYGVARSFGFVSSFLLFLILGNSLWSANEFSDDLNVQSFLEIYPIYILFITAITPLIIYDNLNSIGIRKIKIKLIYFIFLFQIIIFSFFLITKKIHILIVFFVIADIVSIFIFYNIKGGPSSYLIFNSTLRSPSVFFSLLFLLFFLFFGFNTKYILNVLVYTYGLWFILLILKLYIHQKKFNTNFNKFPVMPRYGYIFQIFGSFENLILIFYVNIDKELGLNLIALVGILRLISFPGLLISGYLYSRPPIERLSLIYSNTYKFALKLMQILPIFIFLSLYFYFSINKYFSKFDFILFLIISLSFYITQIFDHKYLVGTMNLMKNTKILIGGFLLIFIIITIYPISDTIIVSLSIFFVNIISYYLNMIVINKAMIVFYKSNK
jgi:hypothetical protein